MSDPAYEVPEQVLQDAETALYRAKAQRRGRHVLFTRTMYADAAETLRIEMDLRCAIEWKELTAYYRVSGRESPVALAVG